MKRVIIIVVLLTGIPDILRACPTCYGAVDSEMGFGMRMAILSLVVVTGGVLGALARFFFSVRRRSRGEDAGKETDPATHEQGESHD